MYVHDCECALIEHFFNLTHKFNNYYLAIWDTANTDTHVLCSILKPVWVAVIDWVQELTIKTL